ncbi:hypothetical protein ACA910_017926 [Epithemia clementina (nom. ined.)]
MRRMAPSSLNNEDTYSVDTEATPPLQANGEDSPSHQQLTIGASSSLSRQLSNSSPSPPWPYWSTAAELAQAGTVGAMTGLLVAVFKLSIEAVRLVCYGQDIWVYYPSFLFVVPMLGGMIVGLISWFGGPYPPGLRGTLQEVEEENHGGVNESGHSSAMSSVKIQGNFARKSTAAVVTLGTGCSLGPEGPCVELGMNVARASLQFAKNRSSLWLLTHPQTQNPNWHRVLLSSGAAAGVAAGFNAPIAGVFFALEIMQNAFQSMDRQQKEKADDDITNTNGANNNNNNESAPPQPQSTSSNSAMTTNPIITPILMASVISALISQDILGNHLIFKVSQGLAIQPSLSELPLYILLGAMSGLVAFAFSYSAKISQSFFAGEWGFEPVKDVMSSIPDPVKPAIGGLLCGLVGLAYPQILFFGYETLNPLLKSQAYLPITVILSLLGVKTIMTAVCAGSGLVGGTFAPSLFLGSMTGAAFRDGAARLLELLNGFSATLATTNAAGDGATLPPSTAMLSNFIEMLPIHDVHLSSVPAYAMVGAASVLASLFRAPLTATLLLFEVTRNYEVLLPIMASAGVASIISDILEDTFERRDEMQRRDFDPVSWGDLADGGDEDDDPSPLTNELPSFASSKHNMNGGG